jgi:hypothetical protein
MKDEDKQAISDFKKAVNMTANQLEKWLATKESKEVGFKDEDGGESVGHKSGKKIIELLGKRQGEYTAADLKHIHKVSAMFIVIWRRNQKATSPKQTGDIR